jgi:aldose 1-epimerase
LSFSDGSYELFPNEKGRPNAIHGLVYAASFEVKSQLVVPATATTEATAFLTLQYSYAGTQAGYPFPFYMTITYALQEKSGFSMQYYVLNTGKKRMPLGLGWHPYVGFEGESVDDWSLGFSAEEKMILDEGMIPVQKEKTAPLTAPFSMKDQQWDDVFGLGDLARGARHTTHLFSKNKAKVLSIWQDHHCPYLVIFTPHHRRQIAIEPMTCNADAFNNREGLRVLFPGKSLTAQMGIQLRPGP